MNPAYNASFSGDDPSIEATLEQVLNFRDVIRAEQWQTPGDYYRAQPAQVRSTIQAVVASDEQLADELRQHYFPRLERNGQIKYWEAADEQLIERYRQKYLYAGRVYAADGTLAKYETLSMVGAQIAISRVNYQGDTGQIVTNIMQWGKEIPRPASIQDIISALESRGKSLTKGVANVFLQALMLYKERQLLLECPPDSFKLIHGPIFPYEMLTGAGKQHILQPCLELIGRIIDDGNYAAIVSHVSDADRALLMVGRALRAGEYVIVDTGEFLLDIFFEGAHFTDTQIPQYGNRSQRDVFTAFRNDYGQRVVRGVLRAHWMSPPFLFYCNADRVTEAVHILLADASHTPRGFPLLIDMADHTCSALFKQGDYTTYLNTEFARASGSGIYGSERSTRD